MAAVVAVVAVVVIYKLLLKKQCNRVECGIIKKSKQTMRGN